MIIYADDRILGIRYSTYPCQEDWVTLITQQKTSEPEPDTAKIPLSVLLKNKEKHNG